MPVRHIGLLLAFVGILAASSRAKPAPSATQPAAGAAVAMDLKSVVFDWTTPEWKPNTQDTPPLLLGAGWGVRPQAGQCRHLYASALSGHAYPGSRYLVGFLGGPFPTGATIVPERFERQGDEFLLVLRFVPRPAGPDIPPKRPGDFCFFGAMLDDSLPDGAYDITVELKDLPNDLDVPAIQRQRFSRPDISAQKSREEMEHARTLSPQDLFNQYLSVVARLDEARAPREADHYGYASIAYYDPDADRLSMLRQEIVRRGVVIGPLLIDVLKEHAVRNPDLRREDPPPHGLAREMMELLARIGDARAAPVMLDILSGKLRCNRFVTESALTEIEKLTFVRFRKFEPHHTSFGNAVCAQDAKTEPDDRTFEPPKPGPRQAYIREIAAKYTKWLADHPADGSDSTPWAKEAVRMARAWLESDDLVEGYNAASFLSSGPYRSRAVDDDPARTLRRIAAILDQCEVASCEKTDMGFAYYSYRYKPTGVLLPVSIHNWTGLMLQFRSVPPQYTALFIRLDREMPDYPGAMAGNFFHVSGRDAMAYRIEAYKRLCAQAAKAGIDLALDLNKLKDRKHQTITWNTQEYRWGIERWAGRTFAGDAEMDAWWAAEKEKTQQQWLEAGLPITAARADAGDRQSQYLLRLMLGNALPNPPDHLVWMEPGFSADPPPHAERGEAFRVKWVKENGAQLKCDGERGVFVLTLPPVREKGTFMGK
jgi:hypothetical protein